MAILYKVGGGDADFVEIFTITIMKFIKKVVGDREFVLESNLHNYLVGIAKFTYLEKFKSKAKSTIDLCKITDPIAQNTPETLILELEKVEFLHSMLGTLGKNCKEVLMYWANGYSMKEIAKKMNYKSEGMARKKKHNCFKSLLAIVNENPSIKEALR